MSFKHENAAEFMVNHFLELILVLDLYMSYMYTLQFLSKNKIASGVGRNLMGGRTRG